MKIRYLIGLNLTLFFLLLSFASKSQDTRYYEQWVSEGNRYYQEEQYHLAIQYYKDALDLQITDPGVDYKLATCYRNTFNYSEAEAYYLKVYYLDPDHFPLSQYYYALMLKLNGNPLEAIAQFDHFIDLNENNPSMKDFVEQAIVEKAGSQIAQQDFGRELNFTIEILEPTINTVYNDFAPVFRDSQTLVLTSSRVHSNRTLIDERYGEAFTDNYYFQRKGNVWEEKTKQFFSITNSRSNDGSGSFTKKGDQYFFTVCEEHCRIFETHLSNNKWTVPVLLNELINIPDSDSKQPAISPGGDTLFFVSNRAGGYGQYDIWMSIDTGENQWSKPVNGGKSINTRSNELSPAFNGVATVLFFASDGHPGYGGFDLFMARRRAAGDTVLHNMNYPFNSIRDDCFLTFNGREILWSSNRAGGYGGFDIYSSKTISVMGLISKLSSKERNDSRTVSLISRTARSENINLLASRNEETIDYNNLTYEKKQLVNKMVENRLKNKQVFQENFSSLSREEFETLNTISQARFQTLLLNQKYSSTLLKQIIKTVETTGALSVTGVLMDSKTGSPLNSSRVLLTNKYGEILKITITNENGQFRFTDVPGDCELFLRMVDQPGRPVKGFVKDIKMLGSDAHNALYVENIYFDFDHYTIRPEAAQVLDQLAAYLKSNPGAQVEVFAYADDRGSNAYNFELTQKRGQAVVSYLTKYGVDETSLAIVPRGKQNMAQAANEVQRQFNRRAEFYINGVKETFSKGIKTYIIKKEADWTLISKLTGISQEELRTLNGSETNTVKAFQPVRLPLNANIISAELFFAGI